MVDKDHKDNFYEILKILQAGYYNPNNTEYKAADINNDAPIIKLVNYILEQAVTERASDIHVEPQEDRVQIRFRVDGILYTPYNIPLNLQANLISRIKIMAGIDIAEKRLPQDGHFQLTIAGRAIDFRAATLPTSNGEKIALRILDRETALYHMQNLGLSEQNYHTMQQLSRLPYGMVLIVGPTGSGKTTTLYSLLQEFDKSVKNIITLEDPIEYTLPGINQVQINPAAGLTFAQGLRSILRQDPDVIMVGEIRDQETAGLVVHAALTGHMVLSTLHTNTAAGSVARLLDMGVEPFVLSSCLSGVIAQRLVRRLCSCREELSPGEQKPDSPELYRVKGCSQCRYTGYWGRLALHEILLVSDEISRIIKGAVYEERVLEQAALPEGFLNLRNDGLAKVRQGLTSWEEVLKSVR